jgi:hypothetical protein
MSSIINSKSKSKSKSKSIKSKPKSIFSHAIRNRTIKTKKNNQSLNIPPSIVKLKKTSDVFFNEQIKMNKFYRINVYIECFYFINNILNKIELKDPTVDNVIDAIIKEIMKTNQENPSFLLMIGGGLNIRDIIKFLFILAMGGFMLNTLREGVTKCQKTRTFQTTTQNVMQYYSKNTKCEYIELPYFSSYINFILTNNIEQYTVNTIYSIYLCDEYQHLGHEEYCKSHTCLYPKKIIDEANSYISIASTYMSSFLPIQNEEILSKNKKPKAKNNLDVSIFNYFYANNLKTDIITITNDMDICYNNVVSPLFWIGINTGISGIFMHMFSKMINRIKG